MLDVRLKAGPLLPKLRAGKAPEGEAPALLLATLCLQIIIQVFLLNYTDLGECF